MKQLDGMNREQRRALGDAIAKGSPVSGSEADKIIGSVARRWPMRTAELALVTVGVLYGEHRIDFVANHVKDALVQMAIERRNDA